MAHATNSTASQATIYISKLSKMAKQD